MRFAELRDAIAEIAPITAFSGVATDQTRASWRATFSDQATQDQIDAANALIAACDPEPSSISTPAIAGRLLIKALTDDQAAKIKQRDLLRLAGDPSVPITNSVVARAAGKAGLDVIAWFDAAAKPD